MSAKKSAGFLDAVRAETKKPGGTCGIARLMASDIDPVLKAEIAVALDDDTLTHAAILRALLARDIGIARSSVEKHRRRECGCARVVR